MSRIEVLPPGTWLLRSRRLGVSVLLSSPAVLVGALLALAAATTALVSLRLGDFSLSTAEVWAALTGAASPMHTHIVVDLRLPRALTALGVGAALGISGTLLQQLARNPLVSPDVVGINAGASAAAVLTIVYVGGSTLGVAAGALLGALATTLALYALAYRRGVTGHRLVLVGIAVSAMLGAATSYALTRADLATAQRAMIWITGSLANREWPHAAVIGLTLGILGPLAFALLRQLRLLQLGEDTAAALGGRVQPARAGLLFTAAALAALSTAVAGPVAFVALMAPQVVRRILGGRSVGLLPAAVCGAALVAGSDLVARTVFGSAELPVGVITGILGAPFLLYLLARSNKTGRGV